ncbi:YhgE/Pip domain-containing protein [Paenibacillus sp. N1-5-1-14]|uniref:YhgE/Pip domain-containing protein n=1 Tax=Paenibacillus radicibacter TaxID=2972488 RepID=UPI0021598DEF|nr:YhgE/Pip domain-containing protein [Paenibacillus radicibacter]MCR8645356.1 YhgE/Pip domain-containing protein [Paenibacillus radicibacter]
MRSIFQIFGRDVKGIANNWVVAVIITGLIFLAPLYAWFNIWASWDPYGSTAGLLIGVVNEDKGATVQGKAVNVGDEIIDSLKENNLLGWRFVDKAEAQAGVERGKYYATIDIPSDFSEKIATILTNDPVKPEILYSVNEKINPVAPKITAKGASGITEQISHNFVKTATSAIFTIFNQLGADIQQNLPSIEKVKQIVFNLEGEFPHIKDIINIALTDAGKAQNIVNDIDKNLPTIDRLAKNGQEMSADLMNFFSKADDALTTAGPAIKKDLMMLQEIAASLENITSLLMNSGLDPSKAIPVGNALIDRLSHAGKAIDGLNNLLDRLQKIGANNKLAGVINKLSNVQDKFNEQQNNIQKIMDLIKNGKEPTENLIKNTNALSKEIKNSLSSIIDSYDSTIMPAIQDAIEKSQAVAKDANSILTQAQKDLPDVSSLLTDAAKGINLGTDVLNQIKQDIPAIEAKVHELANKIRDFDANADIRDVIELLKHDIKKQSDFFAEPVTLKENRIFLMPNYGSAMSPFFTTLSLWVGALLLVSLLSVDVHQPGTNYASYQVFFGRYLTFASIAMMQALVVTVGDIFMLGTYVVHPMPFILFGILNSAIFMLIIYTLVSIFGDVGKAIAVILLVLQISGSGGTFPIQVTPPFFQAIYPFLPFTHAINIMREAAGGIVPDLVTKNITVLLIYAGIMIVLGVVLKKSINKLTSKFAKKLKSSDLMH